MTPVLNWVGSFWAAVMLFARLVRTLKICGVLKVFSHQAKSIRGFTTFERLQVFVYVTLIDWCRFWDIFV
jgi:hypothetical protein